MNSREVRKVIKWLLFLAYISVLLYIVFFAEALGRMDKATTYHYNLVPFKEIKRFIVNRSQLGTMAVVLNVFGNVVAFMPFPFFLKLLTNHKAKLYTCVLLTFAFSLAIESCQLLFKVGSFDVDDLMLNTLGGILGYVCFLIYKKVKIIFKF